jgi:hypothetical protein
MSPVLKKIRPSMKPVDNYQYDYMFEFVVLKYDQYLSLIPFCGAFS